MYGLGHASWLQAMHVCTWVLSSESGVVCASIAGVIRRKYVEKVCVCSGWMRWWCLLKGVGLETMS
jgi:hypothetical protein